MSARNRTLPARCALAAAALSFVIALIPAPAFAGGPGVTVIGEQLTNAFTLAGDQLSSDVPQTSFTVRERPGSAGRKVSAGGMSIRSVLERAGVSVSSLRRIAISRGDGSDLVLTRADLTNGFPEGPALIADTGSSTRVFRPVRNARDVNVRDDFDSGAGSLLIRVDDATALAVQASATPTQVRTGKNVTFTAKVLSPPPGLVYHWEFGDGSSAEGKTVTHSFDVALDKQVQVTVTGNCARFCQGLDSVTVKVGEPRPGENAPGATNPGSGTGNPLAAGDGTGTGENGPGGSGGGNTPGGTGSATDVQSTLDELARQRAADAARVQARKDAAAQRKRDAAAKLAAEERAQRKVSPAEVTRPSGLTITGILLAGQGAALEGGLPPLPSTDTPAGAPKGSAAARGTSLADTPTVPASVAFAIFVIGMGALRERRLVKLRVA
jgi:hypothetical protein